MDDVPLYRKSVSVAHGEQAQVKLSVPADIVRNGAGATPEAWVYFAPAEIHRIGMSQEDIYVANRDVAAGTLNLHGPHTKQIGSVSLSTATSDDDDDDDEVFVVHTVQGPIRRDQAGIYLVFQTMEMGAGHTRSRMLAQFTLQVREIYQQVNLPAGVSFKLTVPPSFTYEGARSGNYRLVKRAVALSKGREHTLEHFNDNVNTYRSTVNATSGATLQDLSSETPLVFQEQSCARANLQRSLLFSLEEWQQRFRREEDRDHFQDWSGVLEFLLNAARSGDRHLLEKGGLDASSPFKVLQLFSEVMLEYADRYPLRISDTQGVGFQYSEFSNLSSKMNPLDNSFSIQKAHAIRDSGLYLIQESVPGRFPSQWQTRIVYDVSVVDDDTVRLISAQGPQPDRCEHLKHGDASEFLGTELRPALARARWAVALRDKNVASKQNYTASDVAAMLNNAQRKQPHIGAPFEEYDAAKEAAKASFCSLLPERNGVYVSYLQQQALATPEAISTKLSPLSSEHVHALPFLIGEPLIGALYDQDQYMFGERPKDGSRISKLFIDGIEPNIVEVQKRKEYKYVSFRVYLKILLNRRFLDYQTVSKNEGWVDFAKGDDSERTAPGNSDRYVYFEFFKTADVSVFENKEKKTKRRDVPKDDAGTSYPRVNNVGELRDADSPDDLEAILSRDGRDTFHVKFDTNELKHLDDSDRNRMVGDNYVALDAVVYFKQTVGNEKRFVSVDYVPGIAEGESVPSDFAFPAGEPHVIITLHSDTRAFLVRSVASLVGPDFSSVQEDGRKSFVGVEGFREKSSTLNRFTSSFVKVVVPTEEGFTTIDYAQWKYLNPAAVKIISVTEEEVQEAVQRTQDVEHLVHSQEYANAPSPADADGVSESVDSDEDEEQFQTALVEVGDPTYPLQITNDQSSCAFTALVMNMFGVSNQFWDNALDARFRTVHAGDWDPTDALLRTLCPNPRTGATISKENYQGVVDELNKLRDLVVRARVGDFSDQEANNGVLDATAQCTRAREYLSRCARNLRQQGQFVTTSPDALYQVIATAVPDLQFTIPNVRDRNLKVVELGSQLQAIAATQQRGRLPDVFPFVVNAFDAEQVAAEEGTEAGDVRAAFLADIRTSQIPSSIGESYRLLGFGYAINKPTLIRDTSGNDDIAIGHMGGYFRRGEQWYFFDDASNSGSPVPISTAQFNAEYEAVWELNDGEAFSSSEGRSRKEITEVVTKFFERKSKSGAALNNRVMARVRNSYYPSILFYERVAPVSDLSREKRVEEVRRELAERKRIDVADKQRDAVRAAERKINNSRQKLQTLLDTLSSDIKNPALVGLAALRQEIRDAIQKIDSEFQSSLAVVEAASADDAASSELQQSLREFGATVNTLSSGTANLIRAYHDGRDTVKRSIESILQEILVLRQQAKDAAKDATERRDEHLARNSAVAGAQEKRDEAWGAYTGALKQASVLLVKGLRDMTNTLDNIESEVSGRSFVENATTESTDVFLRQLAELRDEPAYLLQAFLDSLESAGEILYGAWFERSGKLLEREEVAKYLELHREIWRLDEMFDTWSFNIRKLNLPSSVSAELEDLLAAIGNPLKESGPLSALNEAFKVYERLRDAKMWTGEDLIEFKEQVIDLIANNREQYESLIETISSGIQRLPQLVQQAVNAVQEEKRRLEAGKKIAIDELENLSLYEASFNRFMLLAQETENALSGKEGNYKSELRAVIDKASRLRLPKNYLEAKRREVDQLFADEGATNSMVTDVLVPLGTQSRAFSESYNSAQKSYDRIVSQMRDVLRGKVGRDFDAALSLELSAALEVSERDSITAFQKLLERNIDTLSEKRVSGANIQSLIDKLDGVKDKKEKAEKLREEYQTLKRSYTDAIVGTDAAVALWFNQEFPKLDKISVQLGRLWNDKERRKIRALIDAAKKAYDEFVRQKRLDEERKAKEAAERERVERDEESTVIEPLKNIISDVKAQVYGINERYAQDKASYDRALSFDIPNYAKADLRAAWQRVDIRVAVALGSRLENDFEEEFGRNKLGTKTLLDAELFKDNNVKAALSELETARQKLDAFERAIAAVSRSQDNPFAPSEDLESVNSFVESDAAALRARNKEFIEDMRDMTVQMYKFTTEMIRLDKSAVDTLPSAVADLRVRVCELMSEIQKLDTGCNATRFSIFLGQVEMMLNAAERTNDGATVDSEGLEVLRDLAENLARKTGVFTQILEIMRTARDEVIKMLRDAEEKPVIATNPYTELDTMNTVARSTEAEQIVKRSGELKRAADTKVRQSRREALREAVPEEFEEIPFDETAGSGLDAERVLSRFAQLGLAHDSFMGAKPRIVTRSVVVDVSSVVAELEVEHGRVFSVDISRFLPDTGSKQNYSLYWTTPREPTRRQQWNARIAEFRAADKLKDDGVYVAHVTTDSDDVGDYEVRVVVRVRDVERIGDTLDVLRDIARNIDQYPRVRSIVKERLPVNRRLPPNERDNAPLEGRVRQNDILRALIDMPQDDYDRTLGAATRDVRERFQYADHRRIPTIPEKEQDVIAHVAEHILNDYDSADARQRGILPLYASTADKLRIAYFANARDIPDDVRVSHSIVDRPDLESGNGARLVPVGWVPNNELFDSVEQVVAAVERIGGIQTLMPSIQEDHLRKMGDGTVLYVPNYYDVHFVKDYIPRHIPYVHEEARRRGLAGGPKDMPLADVLEMMHKDPRRTPNDELVAVILKGKFARWQRDMRAYGWVSRRTREGLPLDEQALQELDASNRELFFRDYVSEPRKHGMPPTESFRQVTVPIIGTDGEAVVPWRVESERRRVAKGDSGRYTFNAGNYARNASVEHVGDDILGLLAYTGDGAHMSSKRHKDLTDFYMIPDTRDDTPQTPLIGGMRSTSEQLRNLYPTAASSAFTRETLRDIERVERRDRREREREERRRSRVDPARTRAFEKHKVDRRAFSAAGLERFRGLADSVNSATPDNQQAQFARGLLNRLVQGADGRTPPRATDPVESDEEEPLSRAPTEVLEDDDDGSEPVVSERSDLKPARSIFVSDPQSPLSSPSSFSDAFGSPSTPPFLPALPGQQSPGRSFGTPAPSPTIQDPVAREQLQRIADGQFTEKQQPVALMDALTRELEARGIPQEAERNVNQIPSTPSPKRGRSPKEPSLIAKALSRDAPTLSPEQFDALLDSIVDENGMLPWQSEGEQPSLSPPLVSVLSSARSVDEETRRFLKEPSTDFLDPKRKFGMGASPEEVDALIDNAADIVDFMQEYGDAYGGGSSFLDGPISDYLDDTAAVISEVSEEKSELADEIYKDAAKRLNEEIQRVHDEIVRGLAKYGVEEIPRGTIRRAAFSLLSDKSIPHLREVGNILNRDRMQRGDYPSMEYEAFFKVSLELIGEIFSTDAHIQNVDAIRDVDTAEERLRQATLGSFDTNSSSESVVRQVVNDTVDKIVKVANDNVLAMLRVRVAAAESYFIDAPLIDGNYASEKLFARVVSILSGDVSVQEELDLLAVQETLIREINALIQDESRSVSSEQAQEWQEETQNMTQRSDALVGQITERLKLFNHARDAVRIGKQVGDLRASNKDGVAGPLAVLLAINKEYGYLVDGTFREQFSFFDRLRFALNAQLKQNQQTLFAIREACVGSAEESFAPMPAGTINPSLLMGPVPTLDQADDALAGIRSLPSPPRPADVATEPVRKKRKRRTKAETQKIKIGYLKGVRKENGEIATDSDIKNAVLGSLAGFPAETIRVRVKRGVTLEDIIVEAGQYDEKMRERREETTASMVGEELGGADACISTQRLLYGPLKSVPSSFPESSKELIKTRYTQNLFESALGGVSGATREEEKKIAAFQALNAQNQYERGGASRSLNELRAILIRALDDRKEELIRAATRKNAATKELLEATRALERFVTVDAKEVAEAWNFYLMTVLEQNRVLEVLNNPFDEVDVLNLVGPDLIADRRFEHKDLPFERWLKVLRDVYIKRGETRALTFDLTPEEKQARADARQLLRLYEEVTREIIPDLLQRFALLGGASGSKSVSEWRSNSALTKHPAQVLRDDERVKALGDYMKQFVREYTGSREEIQGIFSAYFKLYGQLAAIFILENTTA